MTLGAWWTALATWRVSPVEVLLDPGVEGVLEGLVTVVVVAVLVGIPVA